MNGTQSVPIVETGLGKFSALSKLKKRVLILGAGTLAKDLSKVLSIKRAMSVEIIGFLERERSSVGDIVEGRSVIGTYDQLFEIVEKYSVQTIAVCIEDRRNVLPIQTLLGFKALGLEVVDGHAIYEEESGRLFIDKLRPSALIFSTGFQRRALSTLFKNIVDASVSCIGLFALAPIFVLIGILIKIDSSGPVFYQQMRVGLRGQPYMIWKFRSMVNNAEKNGPRWAEINDPRVSRVGYWLRKLRLDELPQLVNIIKGEMSLVGPRPERPVFVQELRTKIPYYDIRHTVRPGITGWAQTQFRYGASAEDSHAKLQYDLYYVKNLSVLLDMHILLQTIRVVMLGEGSR